MGISQTPQALVPASLASGANWTLLNSGGTSLSGSTTITVSGLPEKNELAIFIVNGSSVNAYAGFNLRFNSDAGANYNYSGYYEYASGSYFQPSNSFGSSSIPLGSGGSSASNTFSAFCFVSGCASTGKKVFDANGTPNGTDRIRYTSGGYYDSENKITSVSIISSDGNFDNGTLYILGA